MKTPDFKVETHKSSEYLSVPLIELGLVIGRLNNPRDEKNPLVVHDAAIYAKSLPENTKSLLLFGSKENDYEGGGLETTAKFLALDGENRILARVECEFGGAKILDPGSKALAEALEVKLFSI